MTRPPVPRLSIAHSPDPDDAFMFYGISQNKLSLPFRVTHVLKDIQALNRDAARAKHHVTAISAAAYPRVMDKYWILSVGSSVGRRYGPIVVCRPEKAELFCRADWSKLKIATPGPQTTALLLLRLFRRHFIAVNTPFDRILSAVKNGKVDGGLLIHEGQITYDQWGMAKILDLGKWWHRETGLPIPLGLDVVRKDLGRPMAREIAALLVKSIRLAYRNKKAAVRYALKFGRGINTRAGERFVKMYVNRDTLDMGPQGRKALQTLFRRAKRAGLLRKSVELEIITPK